MPSNVLGAGELAVNRADKAPALTSLQSDKEQDRSFKSSLMYILFVICTTFWTQFSFIFYVSQFVRPNM